MKPENTWLDLSAEMDLAEIFHIRGSMTRSNLSEADDDFEIQGPYSEYCVEFTACGCAPPARVGSGEHCIGRCFNSQAHEP